MAPPNTRPPSRPPLASRIRASFEGKRSKSEVQSPTYANGNGFITQDPDSLRKAVDEAINSETFQTAIAANLAKLIKPSIKSALDTIQPVVEAVYNHEVLLRKTNKSVENILERMETNVEAHAHQRDSVVEPLGSELGNAPAADGVNETDSAEEKHTASFSETSAPAIQERAVDQSTPSANFEQYKQLLYESNTRTATSIVELSSSVEASNIRIGEVVQGISNIQAIVGPTKDSVEALKAFSEQSATTAAVMQAQLDQLKLDIGNVIDSIGGDLGKNVLAMHKKVAAQDKSLWSSHTSKLDAIATDLGTLKNHSNSIEKLEAISAELSGLKGSVDAGNASNSGDFTTLGSHITNILTTIEGHTSTLGEIKNKCAHPELLAALQQSNDSHAAHTAALDEIKERSLGAASAPASIPEGVSAETTAALQDLKADLASLKENIKAGLTSNNENVTGLGEKIDSVLTTVESHKAADASPKILAAVQQSNESHASHAAALEGIKSINAGPAPAADSSDLAALRAQMESFNIVLDAHTSALDEIKTASSSHATALEGVKSIALAPAPVDNAALESQIGALVATVNTHTSALDEIKSIGESHSSALDELKTTSASHATALEGIKSLISEPAPAEDNLSGLESQIAALTRTLDVHTSALDEIKSTGGLHSAALDEIKATGSSHATALENARSLRTEPAPAVDSSNLHTVEAQIAAIIATLTLHTSTLDELKSDNGSHNAAVINALGTHTSALHEIKGTATSHAAALEQARTLGDASPAAENTSIASLEAQVATIVATLEAHTAVLDHIKSSEASKSTAVIPISNPEAVEGQFSTIIETLDAHTNLLNELKDDVSAEILTTLHELGQSQARHGDLLTEIREADVSDEILTLLHASGESHATTGTTLDQIHAHIQALNEAHTAHSTVLDEIKSRSVQTAPAIEGSSNDALETQINGIASTLQSHTTALSSIQELHASHIEVLNEIRDATAICNESHADHALDLSEIKEISSASNEAHSSHIAALADIKEATAASNQAHSSHTATLAELREIQLRSSPPASRSGSPNLGALEIRINTVITTLENQTAELSAIKESISARTVLEAVNALHEILTSHTSLLGNIKESSSHKDILSNISALKSLVEESKSGIDEHSSLVRDLHSETKEAHSNITSAVTGLALGGVAGAGAGILASHESDHQPNEILNAVKGVKEKVDFVVSQIEINHTTVTTSITTLSDELKAEIDATGTQITESITTLDSNIKALDLQPVTSAVGQCGQVVKDLSAQIDTLESHIQVNNSKISNLHEGLHLNDTGISQIRDHAGTREVVSEPVPESSWFGSGGDSPSAKRSTNPFDRVRVEQPVDEDEGSVLEAIQEVDTPLDNSPVNERFGQKVFEPAIDEDDHTPFEHVTQTDEIEEKAPAEPAADITPQTEETGEVADHHLPHITEHEVETEPDIIKENSESHASPQPEHLEEIRGKVPVPPTPESEQMKQEVPVEHPPPSHKEEMAEEIVPINQEEGVTEEVVSTPVEEREKVEEGESIHESEPAEPEICHAPAPEPESVEKPARVTPAPESEPVEKPTGVTPGLEPIEEPTGATPEREPVEEPIGANPEPETSHEISEAEPAVQQHGEEPESENTEIPRETIPQPESTNETPATASLEEHHAAPEPSHVHEREEPDEAIKSPTSITQETSPALSNELSAPIASHDLVEPDHQAEPSPST